MKSRIKLHLTEVITKKRHKVYTLPDYLLLANSEFPQEKQCFYFCCFYFGTLYMFLGIWQEIYFTVTTDEHFQYKPLHNTALDFQQVLPEPSMWGSWELLYLQVSCVSLQFCFNITTTTKENIWDLRGTLPILQKSEEHHKK